jgi:hypothetical protein
MIAPNFSNLAALRGFDPRFGGGGFNGVAPLRAPGLMPSPSPMPTPMPGPIGPVGFQPSPSPVWGGEPPRIDPTQPGPPAGTQPPIVNPSVPTMGTAPIPGAPMNGVAPGMNPNLNNLMALRQLGQRF